ncbi:MAG: hypothetical protein L7V87_00395 [Verrucomicrobiales bacterium]|nr:hypothetical protein [Verrucomicrobiales bacterium]
MTASWFYEEKFRFTRKNFVYFEEFAFSSVFIAATVLRGLRGCKHIETTTIEDYNGTNLQAVREGEWKLHLPRTPQDQPFWNKRANGGRLFVSLEQNALFNLKEDLGEKENVADQNPEVVERLLAQADAIRAELGEVNVKGSDQRDINLIDPQER